MFLLRVIGTSPPLRRGGRGGGIGIASTWGRCDNSAEDSCPGTAHQAVVTRGYPPCPPHREGFFGMGVVG